MLDATAPCLGVPCIPPVQRRCHADRRDFTGLWTLRLPSRRHRRPTLRRSCPIRLPSDLDAVEFGRWSIDSRWHFGCSDRRRARQGAMSVGREGTHSGRRSGREARMVEAVRDQWVIGAGIVLFLIAVGRLVVQSIGARENSYGSQPVDREGAGSDAPGAEHGAARGADPDRARAPRGGPARAGLAASRARVLEKAGASPTTLVQRLRQALGRLPRVSGPGAQGGAGLPLASRERGPDHGRGRSPAHEGRVRERRAPAAGARRSQGSRRGRGASRPPVSPERSCSRRWRPSGAASA
jgi:hypothetical protein